MSEERLAVYLNDHRAGAGSALELLNHIEERHPNTAAARLAVELRPEISADMQVLEGLMQRAGIPQSRPRQAAAWLTEKIAELKVRVDDRTDGSLSLLESLEALSLGVEGKHALWDALAVAAAAAPALQGTDYARLKQRAEDQRRRVEAQRLAAATGALGIASRAE
jgi:hypothetical protein